MRSNGGHGHDAGSPCPVCASILAAARRARRLRRGPRQASPRNGAPRADRVWEAALLGHLQLVSGIGEGAGGD
jgi:hypothetical protein